MVVQTYEVYLRVEKYFQCINFFLLHRYKCFEKRQKTNDISYIFTSEDMENISLISRMLVRKENMSCLFLGKTLISSM